MTDNNCLIESSAQKTMSKGVHFCPKILESIPGITERKKMCVWRLNSCKFFYPLVPYMSHWGATIDPTNPYVMV